MANSQFPSLQQAPLASQVMFAQSGSEENSSPGSPQCDATNPLSQTPSVPQQLPSSQGAPSHSVNSPWKTPGQLAAVACVHYPFSQQAPNGSQRINPQSTPRRKNPFVSLHTDWITRSIQTPSDPQHAPKSHRPGSHEVPSP